MTRSMDDELSLGTARTTLCLLAALFLTSCQYFGPESIRDGRPDYNSAIQNTSAQQVLANIVRANNFQMPLVMDVTQVNAALVVSAGISGTVSGIGGSSALPATGRVRPTSPTSGALSASVIPSLIGGITPNFSYVENPTITYTPLTGQPLVAQLSRPITVESLASLPDSEWPLASILEMSISYLTPQQHYRDLAINALLDLEGLGAISASATRSTLSLPLTKDPTTEAPVIQESSSAGSSDSLTIYLTPPQDGETIGAQIDKDVLREWARIVSLYWTTQPATNGSDYITSSASNKFSSRGMRRSLADVMSKINDPNARDEDIRNMFRLLPSTIELRTSPIPGDRYNRCNAPMSGQSLLIKSQCATLSPVLRTRSAIGILLSATDQSNPLIAFVTPEQYLEIRSLQQPWNTAQSWTSYSTPPFYTIPNLYTDRNFYNPYLQMENRYYSPSPLENFVACYVRNSKAHPLFTVFADNEKDTSCYRDYSDEDFTDPYGPAAYRAETALANLRRYILIVTSDKPPRAALPSEPPYVAFKNGGLWYFISDNDNTSKRNFALLSTFMSIMAIPSQTAQPVPTISVH